MGWGGCATEDDFGTRCFLWEIDFLDPRLRGDDEEGRAELAPAQERHPREGGSLPPRKNVIPAKAGIQKDPWRPYSTVRRLLVDLQHINAEFAARCDQTK